MIFTLFSSMTDGFVDSDGVAIGVGVSESIVVE